MFRQSLNLPISVIRKSPVILTLRERQLIRFYQTSSARWKKLEGEKQECPKERSGRGFYYTLGAVLIGTGAVVAYAKHDDDFRALLRENVPGTDAFVSFVTFEETTPVDFFLRWVADTATLLKDEIYHMILGREADSKALPPCDDNRDPYVPPKPALTQIKTEEPLKGQEQRTYKLKDEAIKIVKKEGEEIKKKVDSKLELLPTNLKQLEESINLAASVAINNYKDAVCVLRAVYLCVCVSAKMRMASLEAYLQADEELADLAEEISQLVENSIENVDHRVFSKIKQKTDEREKHVTTADNAAKKAINTINELKAHLDDPKFPGKEDVKENARRNIRRTIESVEDARNTFKEEMSKMAVTDRYWTRVLEARRHFSEELETLFPRIKLGDKNLKFAEGEIDLFILYAFQNVLFYQKELARLDILAQRRLQEALQQSKLGDPQAIDAVIKQEIEKERRKIGLEFQKRMLGLKTGCENEMRLQLKRQAEAHSDHLRELVDMKEKEMDRKLQRAVDEKLEEEKMKFKEEVAAMVARLKGIDDLMKCRAKSDRRVRASQTLWSACQSLEAALRGGGQPGPAVDLIRPLEEEISVILKSAAKDDELVDVVVSSIPREARIRGVYPESVLRERFLSVERVAQRVALLPDGGASLPVMLLSYLQSFLVLSPANPVPAYELAGEAVEVGKFNTFEILQRARYWVDRGDFVQALKYMNLLDGAAYVVSKDWCNEIRIFLETQQAAEVLMAHASAAGLSYY